MSSMLYRAHFFCSQLIGHSVIKGVRWYCNTATLWFKYL